VEEITMTYVVVAIWDLRRMVLPIAYFIEKPFQNWTRSRAVLQFSGEMALGLPEEAEAKVTPPAESSGGGTAATDSVSSSLGVRKGAGPNPQSAPARG
jgi:hypothetical protein